MAVCIFQLAIAGSDVALAPYFGVKAAYLAIGDSRGDSAYQYSRIESR